MTDLLDDATGPIIEPPSAEVRERALALARTAALAADAKKALDLCVLDLSELSDVFEAIVVCTAANERQLSAVIDEVEERVRLGVGESPISREGQAGAPWVLLDYGAVVVHVFSPEARGFYRLERLWGDAPLVDVALEDGEDEAGA